MLSVARSKASVMPDASSSLPTNAPSASMTPPDLRCHMRPLPSSSGAAARTNQKPPWPSAASVSHRGIDATSASGSPVAASSRRPPSVPSPPIKRTSPEKTASPPVVISSTIWFVAGSIWNRVSAGAPCGGAPGVPPWTHIQPPAPATVCDQNEGTVILVTTSVVAGSRR